MAAESLASTLAEQVARERGMPGDRRESQQRESIPISKVNMDTSSNHESNHLLVATYGSP